MRRCPILFSVFHKFNNQSFQLRNLHLRQA
uniref:Uncharacterized protein n=1 Tax=Rhizophora mucronata TaxID=61149 RepID=A0A2P2J2N9_RHIMU